jgi:hypothetical protein
MSTGTGTLQAPRTNRSMWPAAVIASLLMLSIGFGAFFLGRDRATEAPRSVVGGTEQTVVGGTAANTPSETSHRIVGRPTPKMGVAENAPAIVSGGNTPSELTGGIPAAERATHQRI